MEQFTDMRSLVDYLNKTAHAYYVLDNPIISDQEWDALYNQLLAMEKETGSCCPIPPRSGWAASRWPLSGSIGIFPGCGAWIRPKAKKN